MQSVSPPGVPARDSGPYAALYTDAGYSAIPEKPGTKRPALTAQGAPGRLDTASANKLQIRSLDSLAAPISLTLRTKCLSRRGVVLDGEVIVSTSRDPQFDACRELVRRGLRGAAEFRREGAQAPDFVVKNIEIGAQFMTKETNGAFGS